MSYVCDCICFTLNTSRDENYKPHIFRNVDNPRICENIAFTMDGKNYREYIVGFFEYLQSTKVAATDESTHSYMLNSTLSSNYISELGKFYFTL